MTKKRRVEVTERVIAPGAVVQLKNEHTTRLSERMARWRVLACNASTADVQDLEDPEDLRVFPLDRLELVSGGKIAVLGYEWIDGELVDVQVIEVAGGDDSIDSDESSWDVEAEDEPGSLFDSREG